jgi:hypothetical protein
MVGFEFLVIGCQEGGGPEGIAEGGPVIYAFDPFMLAASASSIVLVLGWLGVQRKDGRWKMEDGGDILSSRSMRKHHEIYSAAPSEQFSARLGNHPPVCIFLRDGFETPVIFWTMLGQYVMVAIFPGFGIVGKGGRGNTPHKAY